MKVAYDFDGVLACEIKDTKFNNWMYDESPLWLCLLWETCTHLFAGKRDIIIKPKSYIITGRCGWEEKITRWQMKKWGYDSCILIIEKNKKVPTIESSLKFKKRMIKELDINRYYEDSGYIYNELVKEFPDKKIIKICKN